MFVQVPSKAVPTVIGKDIRPKFASSVPTCCNAERSAAFKL